MQKESVKIMVLNGWAASVQAWDLCKFMKEPVADGIPPVLFSYVDQLDGKPERMFDDGGRFILVGWSMGGSSAMRLACRYADQIAGLVLIAATPRMMEEKESGWRGMSPRRLEALRKGLEITKGQGFFGIPEGKPNPYMQDDSVNLERGLRYLLETDLREEIEGTFECGCNFPVYIFQSEQDGIVRSANALWLKRIFQQAHFSMVPGSEHALPIMISKQIDDAVQAILQNRSAISE